MTMRQAVNAIGAAANHFPDETGFTLPIPRKEGDHLIVARLTYTQRMIPRKGAVMTPPEYLLTADYDAGRFLQLERVDAARLGVPPPPEGGPLVHVPPSFDSPDERLATYNELYRLYDVLLPPFRAGQRLADEPTRAAARDFVTLFARLAEKPLLGYYEALGGEFFDWVRRQAG